MVNKLPQRIVDRNGKHTTVWVNDHDEDASSQRNIPVLVPASSKESSLRSTSQLFEFGFDDDDTYPFVFGDCHLMAAHLRDNFGLPAVTVMSDFSGDADLAGQEFVHILNALPDGRLVDVNGVHSESEILESWNGYEVVDGDEHIEMSFPQYNEDPSMLANTMMASLGIRPI